MAIRRGTTPALIITAEGVDLTGCTVYVTIWQSITKLIKKTGDDGSVWMDVEDNNTIIYVVLSQAESLSFKQGKALVQIRWVEEDGTAHASDIASTNLHRVLQEGVIEHD